MYLRTIKERVQALAPFLTYDKDPYLVLRDDGSLVWMWDAYTTTRPLPLLAEARQRLQLHPQSAQGGHRRLRRQGDLLPDRRATTRWPTPGARSSPGCSPPATRCPPICADTCATRRTIFSVQADMLATYHMTDPVIFYNKEDVWEIPTEVYENATAPVKTVPYYQVLALPGSAKTEFALVLPFTPLSKQNMTVAAGGPPGRRRLRQAPDGRLPQRQAGLRPAQIEARIDNEPDISSQLTLWSQGAARSSAATSWWCPVGRLGDVLRAALPAGGAEPHPAAHPGDRGLWRQSGHGAYPLGRAGEDLRRGRSHRFDHHRGRRDHHDDRRHTTTTTPSSTTTTAPSSTTTTAWAPARRFPPTRPPWSLWPIALQPGARRRSASGDWARYGQLIDELGKVLDRAAGGAGEMRGRTAAVLS